MRIVLPLGDESHDAAWRRVCKDGGDGDLECGGQTHRLDRRTAMLKEVVAAAKPEAHRRLNRVEDSAEGTIAAVGRGGRTRRIVHDVCGICSAGGGGRDLLLHPHSRGEKLSDRRDQLSAVLLTSGSLWQGIHT